MGFHDEYMKRLFYKELTGPPKTVTQGLIHGMADRDSRQRQINHSPSNYDNADAVPSSSTRSRFSRRLA